MNSIENMVEREKKPVHVTPMVSSVYRRPNLGLITSKGGYPGPLYGQQNHTVLLSLDGQGLRHLLSSQYLSVVSLLASPTPTQQKTGSRKWLDDHIHTFVAVGAPFLGSSKCVRGMVSFLWLSILALIILW